MAMEHGTPDEFEAVVARARAELTGELHPEVGASNAVPIPGELANFVKRTLTDGTYAQEIARIGAEDPDLASI